MENTNNNLKLTIGIAILVALVVAGLLFYPRQQKIIKVVSPTRAKVGTLTITQKDVDNKIAVERVYGNQTLTEDVALQVLVQDATEQEVARAFNVLPAKADISSFEDHANKTTKAPEILQAVKDVFGTDSDSYDHIYILPKIVNISLHTFFSANKDINKEQSASIEKAYAEVTAGGKFIDVAKNNGLQYATSTPSASLMALPPAMQKYFPTKDMPKSKLFTIVESLKPGEIYKTIIEDDYSYSIARLLSAEKGAYKIESVVSKKRDYDTWYKEEAKKISVEIVK